MDVHKYERDEDDHHTKTSGDRFNIGFMLGVMIICLSGYWAITWLITGVRYLVSL